MRILLVEDEPNAARMLAKGLREHAYAVDTAATGSEALYQFTQADYDAVILDVMLAGNVDGLEVCRRLRASGAKVPILMLTARDAVEARIAGLDCGADDYLTKPFDLGELLARLRAVIRRGHYSITPMTIRAGSLEIDTRSREATHDGRPIPLTAREYALLEFLMLHANEVVGRAMIAEHVWDSTYDPMSNVIDVCVQRLRRKIDVPGTSSIIVTRRGEGYMITARKTTRQPA